MNDKKETIRKDYKECILSVRTHTLENSDFLIQTKQNST